MSECVECGTNLIATPERPAPDGSLCMFCQVATLRAQLEEQGEALQEVSVQLGEKLVLVQGLQREVKQLRERCATDPWWWWISEYLDEGWEGPFPTREEAEANAWSIIGEPPGDENPPRSADEEVPEVSFRQHANPAGCAENERLEREVKQLKARHNPEVCVDTMEYCERLKADNERLHGRNVAVETVIEEKREYIGRLQRRNGDCQDERKRLTAELAVLREAAMPFLSLQSPDHSERIAGLIHRTYFDNLRAALPQPEPKEKTNATR